MKALPKYVSFCFVLTVLLACLGCSTNSQHPRWWLTQAMTTVKDIPDRESRDEALHDLAKTLAAACMYSDAVATANAIEDHENRSFAFISIVEAYANAGSFSRAMTTAQQMEDAEGRAFALTYIASAQAKAGRKVDAEETLLTATTAARQIEDDYFRAAEQSRIVCIFADMAEYSKAIAFSDSIEDSYQQVYALNAVAVTMAKAGKREEAAMIFAKTIEIADAAHSYPAFREIADSQSKVGMIAEAKATAERMAADPQQQGSALRCVADTQRKAGLFQDAVTAAKKIPYYFALDSKSWALRDIAEAQAKQSLFADALATAECIEQPRYKAWAFGLIARIQADSGNLQGAKETFAHAISVADQMKDSDSGKPAAYSDVASSMAAAKMYDEAVKITEGIKDHWRKAAAQRDIAIAFARNGKFFEATAKALEIEDNYQRTYAFRETAMSACAGGAFADSIEIAKKVATEDPWMFRDLAFMQAKLDSGQTLVPALELLKEESAAAKTWFCIGVAQGLMEKEKEK